jgi:hypothetical protein
MSTQEKQRLAREVNKSNISSEPTSQHLPLGDYPTRPGEPGYHRKLTPEELEARTLESAAKSEQRQNGRRWQLTP